MSTLRKEYTKSKKRKEEIVSDAALSWLAENVIIINERLDRRAVTRLDNSIQKFDDVFGPFRERVPSISTHLDSAETALNMVVSGRSSERKTSNLLKQMTYLYSTLSSFFAKDLKVLLKSRVFRAARANPEQRLDLIPKITPDGLKHDVQVIQDAFANALKPTKDDKTMLKKIYKSTKLPELEPRRIARELLGLSFNDLEELTQIGKVPMVATPEEVAEPEAPETGAEAELELEHAIRGVFLESVSQDGLLLERIDSQKANQLASVIGQISTAIDTGNPALATLKGNLDKLVGQSRTELAQNKWLGGSAVKQLINFYNVLDNLKQQWDSSIKPLFADGALSDDEKTQLNDLLAAATKDSIFSNIAQKLKLSKPHAAGLDPASVVKAVMDGVNQEGGIEAVTKLLSATGSLPAADSQGEPQIAAGDEEAAPGQPTDAAGQTGEAGTTTGTDGPSGGTEPSPEAKVSNLLGQLQRMGYKTGKQGDEAVEELFNMLKSAGF